MPTFILSLNWTDQGIRAVKDAPKRAQASQELAKKVGVEIKEVYLTSGDDDLLLILDTPNGDNVAKFALALGALGNVRTRMARAWPQSEFQKPSFPDRLDMSERDCHDRRSARRALPGAREQPLPINSPRSNVMRRNAMFAVTTMSLVSLGLVLAATDAVAQQKSIKDQLVGTWTVVSWDQVRADGSKVQRFGGNPKGINVFDANGRFFVMFARPDLPKIASRDPLKTTTEENKAIMEGTIAYYGTYSVSEPDKVLTLRVEASSFPNQVGADQKRTITELTGDQLKYENTTVLSGGQIHVVLSRLK